MSDLSPEKDVLYKDTLIHFYMNNPELFSKGMDHYHVRDVRMSKLTSLSSYLQEMGVFKSVSDIEAAWKDLLKKYKASSSQENKLPSGSGAPQVNYGSIHQNLSFVKPSIQQRKPLSSCDLNSKKSFEGENNAYASSQTYQPFMHIYQPPSQSYQPPMNTYQPPLQTYQQPMHIYQAPSQTCQPPMNNYLPHGPQMNCAAFPQYPYAAVYNPAPYYPFAPLMKSNEQLPPRPKIPSMNANVTKQLNVPPMDKFAKKRKMALEENRDQLNQLNKSVIKTLDKVHEKLSTSSNITNETSTNKRYKSSYTDYSKHLMNALSKIPPESHNDCITYVFKQLDKFDEQIKSMKEN